MIGWSCHQMLWRPFFHVCKHPDKNKHTNHHPIGITIIQNKKVLRKKTPREGGEKKSKG